MRRFPCCHVYCVLLLAVWLLSCADHSTAIPDGDLDSSSEQESDAFDPCSGAAIKCEPGHCIAENGHARCLCPPGFYENRYTCKAVVDGDIDEPDTSEPETDGDDDSADLDVIEWEWPDSDRN